MYISLFQLIVPKLQQAISPVLGDLLTFEVDKSLLHVYFLFQLIVPKLQQAISPVLGDLWTFEVDKSLLHVYFSFSVDRASVTASY